MPISIQRLNYHTGLFLEKDEFNLENLYHRLLRRRLNYGLFDAGILSGLELEYDGTSNFVTVKPGVAVNRDTATLEGKEILVSENVNIPLTSLSGEVFIVLSYDEEQRNADIKPPTSIPARVTEVAKIEPVGAVPSNTDLQIVLGKITIGTALTTPIPDRQMAKLSSELLPGPASAPIPTITSFNPTTGSVGATVTITGTNFTGATAVSFGGFAATTFTVNSPIQITATVPAGAVTGSIIVTTPAGSGASAANFVVTPALPAPTITSFVPTSGGAGTAVTITGNNFTGATAVSFGGVAASNFTVNSPTQITATVPAGAITGPISVTTPGGSGASAINFQVVPAPAFNSLNPFAPRSGFPGNAVGINGQNFNIDAPAPPQVFFGSFPATVTNFTAANIQVTVPAGGGPNQQVPIRVRTSGGEVSSGDLTPPVFFRLNPA